jgi:hypothetical protein
VKKVYEIKQTGLGKTTSTLSLKIKSERSWDLIPVLILARRMLLIKVIADLGGKLFREVVMKTKLFGFLIFTLSCGIILFQVGPAQSRTMEEFCGQYSMVPGPTTYYADIGASVSTCVESDWDHPLEIVAPEASREPNQIISGSIRKGIVLDNEKEGIVLDKKMEGIVLD